MNENEIAKKFERDFQDILGKHNLKDEASLSPTEKERIELARRLGRVNFSRKSTQRERLGIHLLEIGKKTLPRRYRMKQLRERFSPVWAGIGLAALGLLLVVGLSLILGRLHPTPVVSTLGPSDTPVNTPLPSDTPANTTLFSDTPSNATPDVNSGNVTITFVDLSMDFDWMDYQPLVKAFHQQNPTITVKVIPFDHTLQLNYEDYAKQADVIYLNGYNPAALPGFLSLQPLLDATLDFNQGDFWPNSLDSCSNQQGEPYGLPLTMTLEGIYYNPQVFDQAKVQYPQAGWTWDQFKETINQVSSVANGTTTYGLLDSYMGNILDQPLQKQLLANGGKLDPQSVAADLDWYVQFAKQKKLYPIQPPNEQGYWIPSDLTPLVTNGQAAMWIFSQDGAFREPLVKGSFYTPFPVSPEDENTTPAQGFCGAISSGTKNPQAAWTWLEFLSKQDLTGMLQGENQYIPGYLSGRQSVTEASIYWARLSDQEKNAIQFGLEHAWYFPASLWGNRSLGLFYTAFANAISSGTDLATALAGIAEMANLPNQPTPTPTAGPVVLNTAPVPTTTGLPEGVTAINFNENDVMTMDPAYTANGQAIQTLVMAFERLHPEIKVNLTGDVSTPADGDYVHALAQANDCFETVGPGISNSLSADDLLDLTPFLDANPTMKADFYPAFLAPYQKDGKFYGLPADVYLQYIAYNADLLTQLGIPLPKAGWTVDGLLSIANQAANLSAKLPVYGFGGGSAIFDSLGASWYDASVKPPKATFNTPAMAQAMTWMQPLYRKGALYQVIYFKFTDYLNMIRNGQVALWGTSGTTNYNTDPWDAAQHPILDQNLPYTVGYAPLPMLNSGAAMSTSPAGAGYYISSHASQAKANACWALIQFMSGQPSIFGGYTPRQSVLPQEEVGKDPARFAVVQAAIQEYNTDTAAYTNDPLMWAYNDILAQVFWSVANGESVTAVLAKAQTDADAYLACIMGKDLNGMNNAQVFTAVQGCYTIPTPPAP